MDRGWKRRKILIWGKTRPELSQKYREIVCTGGVFEDTKKLVRLYPIPIRYIDGRNAFEKYQWIEADVMKSPSDPRPESYKIRFDNIQLLDVIPTKAGNWDDRKKWIIHKDTVKGSVESLQHFQSQNHTSLALVKPSQIRKVTSQKYSPKERNEFWDRYKAALSQMELPLDPDSGREIKPITPPDYRFKVGFRCDDKTCTGHTFSILDWEVDALYFKLKKNGDAPEIAAQKVVDKIQDDICSPKNDLYFFLGNISTHPQTFTIVGFWYPKIKSKAEENKQQKLF
jgi:hypothetical protein